MFKLPKVKIATYVLYSFNDEKNKTLRAFKQRRLDFSNCGVLFTTTIRHSAEIYLSSRTWFMVGNDSQRSRRKRERERDFKFIFTFKWFIAAIFPIEFTNSFCLSLIA